jgi:HEAT repeat protein
MAWQARDAGSKASWAERFPQLAQRITHLDKRLTSSNEHIRRRVLTTLVSGRPRDSRHYPAFFRALLDDPSPKVRGEAVRRLWEHNHFLERKDLPRSFHVPFVEVFDWQDAKDVARVRDMARFRGPDGGWAIHALGIIGDKDSLPLARNLLASDNVFTRFSAAMALVQLGERVDGMDALHKLTDAVDDHTGFYRYRAAEVLYRLGDKKAIETFFQLLESDIRANYVDGPLDILEDLTGEFFSTAAEWRLWWRMAQKAVK